MPEASDLTPLNVETRVDRLLGGRLLLEQPVSGYRAATDPVFLAAAVPARPEERVLELGIGAGAAGLCLALRVSGIRLAGLEREPLYLALAERNARANRVELALHEGDVAAPPAALKQQSFDHVMLNPPFHAAATSLASPVGHRDRAHREGRGSAVDVWIAAALARLLPKGRITLIHRAERLPEILAALTGSAGEIRVLPLTAREGRVAKRVIVTARKGMGGPFRLLAPFVIHEGHRHLADGDDFTPAARAILRDAAPLELQEIRES